MQKIDFEEIIELFKGELNYENIDFAFELFKETKSIEPYNILLEDCHLNGFFPVIADRWYTEFKIVKKREIHKTYEILNRLILLKPDGAQVHPSFSKARILMWYENYFEDCWMNCVEDDYPKIINDWMPRSFYTNAEFIKTIINTELDDEKHFYIDDFIDLIPQNAFNSDKFLIRLKEISSGWSEMIDVVCERLGLDPRLEVMKKSSEWTPGSALEGLVSVIEADGVWVELEAENNNSIRGFIEIEDLSWSRAVKPSEVVNVGQKINCCVLSINREKNELLLGYKQLFSNPWDNFPKFLEIGKTVFGNVVDIENSKAILELAPGIEGELPILEPTATLNLGDKFEVIISNIDFVNRIISLKPL
jgi:predicted RNA-binding protein with RPS1 domain